MGSPQPPLSMPQPTFHCADKLCQLPLDIQHVLLIHLDSFATLRNLEAAMGQETTTLIEQYKHGISASIAHTEFGPISDAVMAMRVLDTVSNRHNLPQGHEKCILADLLDKPVDVNFTDATTLSKLSHLNEVAIDLAKLFCEQKDVQMNSSELYRFKRAVYRCTTFFELYKEYNTLVPTAGNEGAEEDHENETGAGEDPVADATDANQDNPLLPPRHTFLARFPHQEILEMDCVREFLSDLSTSLISNVDLDLVLPSSPPTSALAAFETSSGRSLNSIATSFVPIHDSNDHSDPNGYSSLAGLSNTDPTNSTINDTNDNPNPNSGPSHSITEDLLLLTGPSTLLALHKLSKALPEAEISYLTHALIPQSPSGESRDMDVFWHEVRPFWGGLKKAYGKDVHPGIECPTGKENKGGRRKLPLPAACSTIMDVMNVRIYGFAVLDRGQVLPCQ
ncbi:hypothetical protein BDZ91DRAFT_753764 [Kalaharituber pfeilii]|nr:hypothetical protein BDZ91DRAFT_753764 [Kalaharituber pfeilii]